MLKLFFYINESLTATNSYEAQKNFSVGPKLNVLSIYDACMYSLWSPT